MSWERQILHTKVVRLVLHESAAAVAEVVVVEVAATVVVEVAVIAATVVVEVAVIAATVVVSAAVFAVKAAVAVFPSSCKKNRRWTRWIL